MGVGLQPAVDGRLDGAAAARAARVKLAVLRSLSARHVATERKLEHASEGRHREERQQRLAFNESAREALGEVPMLHAGMSALLCWDRIGVPVSVDVIVAQCVKCGVRFAASDDVITRMMASMWKVCIGYIGC